MTVTRYRRQPHVSDNIRRAVLGVMNHETGKRQAVTAEPARAAEAASPVPARQAIEPIKINPSLKSRARAMRKGGIGGEPDSVAQVLSNPFKTYEPPPNVMPQGAKTKPMLAMDSALQSWAQNSFAGAWQLANPYGAAFQEGVSFLGYAYLSELTQRPEYRRISERIATEMTRKWIRLTIAGEAQDEEDEDGAESEIASDAGSLEVKGGKGKKPAKQGVNPPKTELEDEDDGDDEPTPEEKAQRKRNEALQKKLRKIEKDMDRLNVRGVFKTVAEFDGWMGRSHLYVDTGEKDPDELLQDIGNGADKQSKARIKKGSLRALKHVEPIWCYPVRYNATEPDADDWYNPQVWFMMQKQVHTSRLIPFVGRPLPDLLKPAYAFGGLSMSQMAKPYVDNWLRTRQAVTQLIESFSVSGVYTNAQAMLQGGGEEVLDRIDLFNITKSNSGTLVLDKEAEEFFNISTPLGTLDALQAQSQEQMSSVSGIPLIVLLGITPTGLNASSEGELRVFYDWVHAYQEAFFREKLHRVLCFVQLNLFGEVDPAIGFEFEPLWSLDEKGEAEVRKLKMETHAGYVELGAIGPDEVRKIEIDDDDSPYNGLDPDDMPEPPEMPPGMEGEMPDITGGAGGSSKSDNREVEGAADQALIEIADDVYAFDEGQFDESKHKRDSGGKFSSTGAGGGGASSEEPKEFKSKKEHIGHLLSKGTTPKEIMQAMGWPSVSMPAQAKSLGLKLEKYTEGGLVKYKGLPMTDAEKAAVKEQAKKSPKVAEEFVAEVAKLNPELAKVVAQIGKPKTESDKPKPEPAKVAPKLTDEQIKKAKKGTAVSINLIPGDKPSIAGSPQMKGLENQIKAFNKKYEGKTIENADELAQKVSDFNNLKDYANNGAKEEQAKKASIEKEVAEKKAKEEAERAEKKKAEMAEKFAADPDLQVHYEAMEALFGGKNAGEAYLKAAMKKVAGAGLKDKMSAADAAPIIAYSGSHYSALNSQIRSGNMSVEQYKFLKSLNAGLDKLPKHDGTTYRKASLSAEQFASYVPGKVIEERGFTSTSKNQGTWPGSCEYTVHGKSGRDIQKLSSHPSEAEVLFKSGTRFLVKSVKGNHITLEEI